MHAQRPATERRINLWSSPRNISTALMYSFAQRTDAAVVDEPLYAHYLVNQTTGARHPDRELILASQDNDGKRVVQQMLHGEYGRPTVIFKQMTHHLVKLDRSFLVRMDNVLLIRNPRAILASFNRVVEQVTAADIGVPQQYDLFQQLIAAGREPAVVDARRLLLDPAGVLKKLCNRLNLNWQPTMLRWPAGPRPEDGVWAPHWYANVHRSTGFQPYQEKTYALSPQLEEIATTVAPLYQSMLQRAL